VFLLGALTLANVYQAIEVPEVSNSGKGEESKHVRRQITIVVVMLLLLLLTLFFLPFAGCHGIGVIMAGKAVRWAGLVLGGFAFALGFWSRITLGRMYTKGVSKH
jgi:protein-S-isoprenylcysteine O-methyltransferase Ste14